MRRLPEKFFSLLGSLTRSILEFTFILPFILVGGFLLIIRHLGETLELTGRLLCKPFRHFDVASASRMREWLAATLVKVSIAVGLRIWPYARNTVPWLQQARDDLNPERGRTNTYPTRDVWTFTLREKRLRPRTIAAQENLLEEQAALDKSASHDEHEERLLERYLKERRNLITDQVQQSAEKDKGIFAMSSALLASSIAFIRYAAAEPPVWKWIIYASWTTLALAIITNALSLHLSARSYDAVLRDLERQYADPEFEPSTGQPQYPLTRWTRRLDWMSTVTFASGVICLAVFAIANFSRNS